MLFEMAVEQLFEVALALPVYDSDRAPASTLGFRDASIEDRARFVGIAEVRMQVAIGRTIAHAVIVNQTGRLIHR